MLQSKMRISDQKLNLKFVQEVEKREVLYNFNLPGYSRKDVVEKAWQEVSEKVNLPVSECREKWRNVRTVFIRKRKPVPKGSRRKAYYLADAMKFCLPYIKILAPPSYRKYALEHEELSMKPERFDDYGDESASLEDITERLEDEQESILPESEYFDTKLAEEQPEPETSMLTETQIDNSCCSKNEKKEAIKMFLLSIIPEVENFSDIQMKLFKRKIFNVIDDISGISYNIKDPLVNSKKSSA